MTDLLWIPLSLVLLWVLFGEFPIDIRKAIGRRDRWTCQEPDCGKSFQDGWMVQAAHYDDSDKEDPGYDDIDNGRILCIDHHRDDHRRKSEFWRKKGDRKRANQHAWAARELDKEDRRTRWWRKQNG